jgi:polyisoprenoid-binding protein YceI
VKKTYYCLFLLLIISYRITAQSFKLEIADFQKFIFGDNIKGNQILFSSSAPLEDFTGTASSLTGTVSFNNSRFASTLAGKFVVKVNSLNTGIELRNRHLQSANWLDATKYPEMTFELSAVSGLKQLENNKLGFSTKGKFTLHGNTREILFDSEAIYLKENEQTQKRAPGDLLGITAEFNINLSDFNVDNSLVGNKVAEKIHIKIMIVGSNKL